MSSRKEAARAKGPARSRATRWRVAVLLLVHALFAAHLAHYLTTGRTLSPLEPSEAMEFGKRSVVNAGLIFFALTLASTLVLGRFFCGWACHVVALQDLCRGLMLKLGITPRPLRSRLLAFVPLLAAGYMFFYPAVARWWAKGQAPEVTQHLATDDFWATFPGPWITLLTFAVCGFAAVYFLGAKGFCTYGCPYGALFGAVDRLAPGRIRVTDACEGCHHCTAVCTSNVDVGREVHDYGMVVDPGCMKCLDCVSVCPTDALYVGFGRPALGAKPRAERKAKRPRLPSGDELTLGLLCAFAFVALRGLYGRVPFLLSLGAATVVAFLLWRAVQLLRRPKVRLVQWELKQDGRLTGAGRAFGALALVGSALLIHSFAVQVIGLQNRARFEDLAAVRNHWFVFPRRPVTADQLERAAQVEAGASRALAWGLVGDARRYEERAWARVIQGDLEGGMADLRAAREHAPRRSNLSVELGHLARAEGDLETALAEYRVALAAFPGSLDVRAYLADVAVELRRPQAALEPLRSCAERRTWDAPLFDQLGALELAAGNPAAARQDLAHALELEPGNETRRGRLVQLWQLEAQRLAEQGNAPGARRAAEQALSLRPGDPSLASWAQGLP